MLSLSSLHILHVSFVFMYKSDLEFLSSSIKLTLSDWSTSQSNHCCSRDCLLSVLIFLSVMWLHVVCLIYLVLVTKIHIFMSVDNKSMLFYKVLLLVSLYGANNIWTMPTIVCVSVQGHEHHSPMPTPIAEVPFNKYGAKVHGCEFFSKAKVTPL